MTRSAKSYNFKIPLVLSLSLITALVLQSEPVKARGVDIIFNMALVLCAIPVCIIVLKKQLHQWSVWRRLALVLLTCPFVLTTTYEVAQNWAHAPWNQARAFEAANEFLNHLKTSDYDAATKQLTSRLQTCLNPHDFDKPTTQPVSWKLKEMDRYINILSGSVAFSDGQELPLEIKMVWREGKWQIGGFIFGILDSERLSFDEWRCSQ